MDTKDLYRVEIISSSFLTQLLGDEEVTGLLPLQAVISATVMVTNQHFVSSAKAPITYTILTAVDFLYAGIEQVQDLATLLNSVSTQNKGSSLFILLRDAQILAQDDQDVLLAFQNPEGETDVTRTVYVMHSDDPEPKSTATEKGLIAFVTILTLALTMVSVVLLWVTGGCIWVKSAMPWYFVDGVAEHYVRKEGVYEGNETVATCPSGILGAVSNDDEENNMPPGFTPTSGIFREDEMMSPFSQVTNMTDRNNNNPLGIISMRKLGRFATPDKKNTAHFAQSSKLSYSSGKK